MRLETLVLGGMLILGGPASADDDAPIANWPAPPYWTAPAGKAGRSALAASAPLPFIALTPCRIVDTRGNAPLTGGFLPASHGAELHGHRRLRHSARARRRSR